MITPAQFHRSRHSPTSPIEQCWRCGRSRAICLSKQRFGDIRDAQTSARLINEDEQYRRPVTCYSCRWCDGWHVTSKTSSKRRRRRVEKQRRKWMIAKHNEREAAS